MSRSAWDDFNDQPDALLQVLDHAFGAGFTDLERARAVVEKDREIIVSGMGASHHAGLVFADLMARHGRPVHCIETGELLHGNPGICRGRTIVLISRSGESVEIVRLLDRIAGLDCRTIGLCNVAGSTLARRVDCPLLLNCPPDVNVAQQSYLATIALLMALAGAVSAEFSDRQAFEPAIAAARETVAALADAARTIGRELAAHRPIYVLGRQSGYATAVEAQLLIHEVAQFPAVAMTGHGFRHGPFEVVDAAFGAIILTRGGTLGALDQALARDIRARQGSAWLCGPGGDLPHAPIAEPFAPLVAVLPIEAAAMRLAEARGVTPGAFRWSSLVTTREDGFSA